MRFFLTYILVFFIFSAHANLDSLESALKNQPDGIEKLDGLYLLASNYNRIDYDKADSIFKEFERIYILTGEDEVYAGKYYNAKGTLLLRKGEHEKGIELMEQSVIHLEKQKDYSNLWNVYNNIGSAYDEMGRLAESLDNYLKSLAVAEEHLGEGAVAGTSINIGIIYAYQEMYDEALHYFIKSKEYHQKQGVSWGLGNNLNNIGQVYSLIDKPDSSLFYFEEALKVWRALDDKKGITMTVHNIGSLYVTLKEYNKAERYLSESLELSYAMNEQFGITLNLSVLGNVYKESGQREKALKILEKSLEYARKNELLPLQKGQHMELYKFFKEENDFENALRHHENYFEIYDSLNGSTAQKNLKEIQTKYDTEKKQAEIERKRAELAEKDLMLTESKARFYVLSLISIAFILIIIFVVYSLRQKNIANKLIEKQKEEVEHQKHLVEEKNQEITDSIEYAKRIQAAILPADKVVKQFLQDSFILYKPKDIVAGDFYWMENKNNTTIFAAADCTGHGVPGAMVSVVCHNALNRSVREYGLTDPGEILDKTKEIVTEEFEKSEDEVRDGMDIALCSLTGNKLLFAGANNPLWIIRNKELIEVRGDKQPIGKYEKTSPFSTHTIDLLPNDIIYIFSDGYVDQFGGERGKKFKSSQLKSFLLSIAESPMQEQRNLLNHKFESWRGEIEQIDDVCVIGVKI